MDAEEFLNELKKNNSMKIQQSLDAIYEICMEQQERGIYDFSISTIAKLGFNRGVPKAQSIRNKTGEKYKALIQYFADVATQKTKFKKPSQSENEWIDEIQNPKHQLLVRIMASELKEAQQMIREIIPPKQRIDIYDHKNMIPDQSFKLSEQEVRALQYLLSFDFQKKWNLKPTHFGELVDESNKPVFKVSTLDALRKALEYLS
ncbi:gamma-mobile-trio protein GmtX [Acinetobacter johnsonii]|uniref:gamma-mobile-trio protein GmtX n=1 Tax=Acinetobacter johnsonii TaxID=40214 RepID=UPI00244C6D8B|nr:gamma-mobile-trio protein GmtX [Acinetobacter johnsonii]MDH1705893.1 gamma-mobile-trio protein GmtX [Acinetobacter johnsonii]